MSRYTGKSDMSPTDAAIIEAMRNDDNAGAYEPLDELARRRLIQEVLSFNGTPEAFSADMAPPDSRLVDRWRWLLLGSAAALVLVVVVGIFWLGSAPQMQDPAHPLNPTPDPPQAFATIDKVTGGVTAGKNLVGTGDQLISGQQLWTAEGTAVLKLTSGIELFAGMQTRLSVSRQPANDSIELRLAQGKIWVSVDPQRQGPQFVVATQFGRLAVTGTIFSVAIEEASDQVQVLRGEVALESLTRMPYRLKAGWAASLSKARKWALSDTERAACWAEVQTHKLVKREPAFAADFVADTNKEQPLASQRRVNIPTAAVKRKTSAKQMLRRIGPLRLAGDWEAVVAGYETLMDKFPNSTEAQVSLVSLGNVQLNRFNNPQAAVKQFNRYLATGKADLAPEALFGKTRALRALGRRSEERATLELFVKRFPEAPQASIVRARLETFR